MTDSQPPSMEPKKELRGENEGDSPIGESLREYVNTRGDGSMWLTQDEYESGPYKDQGFVPTVEESPNEIDAQDIEPTS